MDIERRFFKTLNKILSPIPPKLIRSLLKWVNNGLEKCFKKEMQVRAKYPLTNFLKIAEDIPNLYTKEVYKHNDFYFNATHLKKYAGIDEDDYIRAAMEHGPYSKDNFFWQCDIDSPFNAIIVASNHRKETLIKVCNKNIITVGPYIAYAESLLSKEDVEKEKKRLGNNLLVFPMHSTHWVNIDYNISNFISNIKKTGKGFESIRICMYWKDILRGVYKPYKKAGFEIVCAGHIYETNFLPRLRSLIEISDYTMSNNIGTHIGFCICLNKPHYLIDDDYIVTDYLQNETRKPEREKQSKMSNAIKNNFCIYSDKITDQQFKVAEEFWGTSEIKSKEEMRRILLELADNNYQETTVSG